MGRRLSIAEQRALDAAIRFGNDKAAAHSIGISARTFEKHLSAAREVIGERLRLHALLRWYDYRQHGVPIACGCDPTDMDEIIVLLARDGRRKGVTSADVASRFGITSTQAGARIGILVRRGLLRKEERGYVANGH